MVADSRGLQASEEIKTRIAELIYRWVFIAPIFSGKSLPAPDDLPDISEALAATITRRQPYRDRAIEDAKLWCAGPKPLGFGMELIFHSCLEPEPFEEWELSIARLAFELVWFDSMDLQGTGRNRAPCVWQRVAFEENEWRLVTMWDERDRSVHRDDYRKIYEMYAGSMGP